MSLDLLWTIPWIRTRRRKQARAELEDARTHASKIETYVKPFSGMGVYLPERIKRPLLTEVIQLDELTIPSVARTVQRAHDDSLRGQLELLRKDASQLRMRIASQNHQFVRRAITEHSKLLIEELRLDPSQQEATVRDDERNLVIAAAGSGKTRTLIARIRYLLDCDIEPTAILAVTFTNKATEEMEHRLKQMAVVVANREHQGVTVSTLHALGKRVVQATMSGPISVAEENWAESLVAHALHDARTNRDLNLAHLYLNAIIHFYRDRDERASDHPVDLTYRTLQGEHVRSVGERIVADFLFTHHVPYKYEEKATWAEVGAGRDAYHPDFFLPKTDAYIEYWGINRGGEVPANWATSSALYKQGMAWKHDQFRRQRKTLIEFFDYERVDGTLDAALQARLKGSGVTLRPMTLDELEKVVGDTKYVGDVIERLLVQFIANARSLRLRPDEILNRIGQATPRVHHFGLLGVAILQRYEAQLASQGRVDFPDMLHRAADILEKDSNPLPKFEHILVDEFQDTSAAMARFLKALLAVNSARLFAVGDDWQAIYGFAGGDVDHIVNFESHFGLASRVFLNVNYRSPLAIVEAGSALIARNLNQIPKQVVVSSQDKGEAYVHTVSDDDSAIVATTVHLIQSERRRVNSDEDILVLSRTKHLLEKVSESCRATGIQVANMDRNTPGVRILSAHRAKGLEANTVIIVNASDHLFGFPSKVENPDILRPVRMSPGNDEAEERRLFYVAVTRAMKRLHLVVRQGRPSPYLAEIESAVPAFQTRSAGPSSYRRGARFNDTFRVERIYPLSSNQAKARIRQSGLLVTNTNKFSFTSYLPFDLGEGSSYWLEGVLVDRPYRDRQQVRLDLNTRVKRQTISPTLAQTGVVRELRPHPSPSYQPHRYGTSQGPFPS